MTNSGKRHKNEMFYKEYILQSNIKYFFVEKNRQELNRLINYYGGISNNNEIMELSRKIDEVLIEIYKKNQQMRY